MIRNPMFRKKKTIKTKQFINMREAYVVINHHMGEARSCTRFPKGGTGQ
jgi:hypothetical protein